MMHVLRGHIVISYCKGVMSFARGGGGEGRLLLLLLLPDRRLRSALHSRPLASASPAGGGCVRAISVSRFGLFHAVTLGCI